MSALRTLARRATITAATVALALTGTSAAQAADVSLPAVEDNRVSVDIDNPLPNWAGLRPPYVIAGQTCVSPIVPLHAIPAVVAEVLPVLDGGIANIIGAISGMTSLVTMLHLPGSPLLIATLPGAAGTLEATEVRDDFYIQPVICSGGATSDNQRAPMEINLFLTQVGSPLGAFEGSVTGSVGGTGSAEGSSIGLGSGELGVGSADGMVELGSTSGSNQGSAVDVGFHGSLAEVTSGSIGVDVGVGSTGSEAGIELGKGSIDSGSTGAIDTSSLTSSVELPEGSSNGSSIDVGSLIPLAEDVAGSVGGLDFPSS